MSKEICISTTPHETRLAILENDELSEIYYERENEYTLAGSIYKGKVTRVLPGMQSAFVDIGLERDAFLYVTDFLEEQEDGADFESADAAPKGRREHRDQNRDQNRDNRQQAQAQPDAAVASSSSAEEGEDSEAPSGTRRWRGRRGRRRGVRNRSQEEAQNAPASTETEIEAVDTNEIIEEIDGFLPSADEEPVAAPVPVAAAPAAHAPHAPAFVLPGESLSKYGGVPKAEEPKAEAAVTKPQPKINYVAPKPSTLIEAPIEWDGKGLLPGESLSRYRDREEVPAVEAVSATEENAPEELEAVSTVQEPEVAAAEVSAPAVGEESDAAPIETQSPSEELVPEETEQFGMAVAEVNETPAEDASPEPSVVEENGSLHLETEQPEHAEEMIEEVHEFEPENASASHRVDPVAPSEFRVASEPEEESHVEDANETHETHEIDETIHEPGQMTEELPVEVQASAVEIEEEPATEAAEPPYGFAPGEGSLEEETIDEEEYDFEPLHAYADDQDEELEEETLDHTAPEIGELVREVHLSQRVSDEPEEEAEEENGYEDAESVLEDVEDAGGYEVAEAGASVGESVATPGRAPRREDRGRRGDRRDNRRGGGGHQGGRGRQGGRRQSAQTMDLPIISDLLKQGQEILVQIAKEPIAKKGARITSHIALPGRFLVFMPTVNHVGVSRKISSDEERQRLKRILISERGEAGGGFIVRTAADGASEEELRADLRFLISLWTEIKQREESSKAPALIYHDLNLVERVLRDQVSDNFSAIWVDNEVEYERTVRFLNRFQPSLVRRVKLYTKETPLFEHFGIQDEISKALKSKVWLKSGGSIVINQTEALVAIDINTGKYVGKTARLEDTILKTNLDAIPEIVRQIRLRDLGGIIVIDFIDMDERKNRHKVMAALEEELKKDRAPSKVLQFNDFGLVAITRKRVKQSLERTLSTPCSICTGTGMVKSPVTVANEIYVEMRKMQKHLDRNDVMLRVNPEVVKTLKAGNGHWLNELEELAGKTIIVKSDPTLHPEQFDIH
ncbi:Rne/Rng family ribonuclease [Silvibacterium acidisoli]|uniref:Rne/Rng family ribonuclease n=1 Tax=Acidobacteriaceae bacterium ZG23-2 TaxID=2883246 RepID=UPI00406C6E98